MATNLYDHAYDLEKALRSSEEYTNLKKLYDQVNADESASKLFANFRDIQMRLQEKQMTGQEILEEEVQQAQKAVALVQQHSLISQLMEAEQRMSMAIAEINKIIMKPLEELYGSMNS
ncbi:MAG TPA: YlbF family regulator [Chondromyces sp.]|nr:YlbF family regulator [Chondromyces sp.]